VRFAFRGRENNVARFTAIAALLYLIGLAISYFSPNSIFTLLEGLGSLCLFVSALYYAFRVFRALKRRWLWKVRNKIIVSFAFVGIIPIVILGGLLWLMLRVALGQLAVLYLDGEVHAISERLDHANQKLCLDYYQGDREGLPAQILQSGVESALAGLNKDLGAVTWELLRQDESGPRTLSAREGPDGLPVRRLVTRPLADRPSNDDLRVLPAWTVQGFNGLAFDRGRLFFRSIAPVQSKNGTCFSLLELPFDLQLIQQIRQKTSVDLSLPVPLAQFRPERVFSEFITGGTVNFISIFRPADWQAGGRPVMLAAGLRVPMMTVYEHYFASSPGLGSRLFVAFWILVGLFVLVEGFSLLIGIVIARSITSTIHGIDEGARNIQSGNFEYRIATRNRDQLEAMAASFNRMAESVVGLMRQVSEKERLEKEIEIAREVQAKLFPQVLPAIQRLQLAASCVAARQVSGDYYDFIPYGPDSLDVIIGDISGKGISAALLMASLQSSIRTLISFQTLNPSCSGRIAQSVGEINRQLYLQTSPDKYATLVMSRIDARHMRLTYCNAGHNPPLVVSGHTILHLTKGGMVAGLFEDPYYDEETIDLHPHDLVVFYTDGIVEAENPSGEQFGEDRLADLLLTNSFLTAEDIQALIFDQLESWVAGGEQRDDMTVAVVKIEAP
jgi:sigma-B regulation protein RsbU (phosphoserine phosphatase)